MKQMHYVQPRRRGPEWADKNSKLIALITIVLIVVMLFFSFVNE